MPFIVSFFIQEPLSSRMALAASPLVPPSSSSSRSSLPKEQPWCSYSHSLGHVPLACPPSIRAHSFPWQTTKTNVLSPSHSWQALPVLSPPSHTHTPFSPLFQGSLAENYHISCVITLASWAGPRLARHWQPEMSPATQVGTGSPAPLATRDPSPGGNVTRLRPTTGSPALLSLVWPHALSQLLSVPSPGGGDC